MEPCTRTISPDQPGGPSQQLHEVLIAEKTVFKNILKDYLKSISCTINLLLWLYWEILFGTPC